MKDSTISLIMFIWPTSVVAIFVLFWNEMLVTRWGAPPAVLICLCSVFLIWKCLTHTTVDATADE